MSESIESYVPGLSATDLDSTMIALLATQRRCEWLVCRYLADIADKGFSDLGYFADVLHYAKERLKLGVKLTRERVRIGKALRDLPRIEGAFVAGDISYSKVREITRVAVADDEDQWLELALTASTREVERAVAGQIGGEDGTDETPANVRWRTPQTVEVNMVLPADTWALLERAMQGAKLQAEGPLTDAKAVGVVASLALAALSSAGKGASAADPRKAVVVYHCKDCCRSEMETNAGAVPLTPAAAEQHGCGAKVVDLDTEGWQESFGGEIPAPVRRAVLARDRGRCRACGRRRFVEVHHLTPRSEGGAHSRAGCACLCTACHAAVHEGKLRVEGDAESGLRFVDDLGNEIVDRLEGGSAAAKAAQPATKPALSERAAKVLAAMDRRGGWHADHLVNATGLHVREVNRALTELQFAGLIRQDYRFLWEPDTEPAQSPSTVDAPIGASMVPRLKASPSGHRLEGGAAAKDAQPLDSSAWPATAPALSEEAAAVLAVMGRRGGWHADHLADATQLPYRAVSCALLELQLAGLAGQDFWFNWEPVGSEGGSSGAQDPGPLQQ